MRCLSVGALCELSLSRECIDYHRISFLFPPGIPRACLWPRTARSGRYLSQKSRTNLVGVVSLCWFHYREAQFFIELGLKERLLYKVVRLDRTCSLFAERPLVAWAAQSTSYMRSNCCTVLWVWALSGGSSKRLFRRNAISVLSLSCRNFLPIR